MAMALPVLGRRLCSVPDLVEDGTTGFTVHTNSTQDPATGELSFYTHVDEFAELVLALHRDPARRRAMGARGREKVGRCCAMETFVGGHMDLYENLYAEKVAAAEALTEFDEAASLVTIKIDSTAGEAAGSSRWLLSPPCSSGGARAKYVSAFCHAQHVAPGHCSLLQVASKKRCADGQRQGGGDDFVVYVLDRSDVGVVMIEVAGSDFEVGYDQQTSSEQVKTSACDSLKLRESDCRDLQAHIGALQREVQLKLPLHHF
mmetsp:Transcript_53219/g.121294  ORF Transcript_53219/g.121294 Transcript_53219/m.121294 type:complete len:260 (-) Transcript_53219:299-1078(-)